MKKSHHNHIICLSSTYAQEKKTCIGVTPYIRCLHAPIHNEDLGETRLTPLWMTVFVYQMSPHETPQECKLLLLARKCVAHENNFLLLLFVFNLLKNHSTPSLTKFLQKKKKKQHERTTQSLEVSYILLLLLIRGFDNYTMLLKRENRK